MTTRIEKPTPQGYILVKLETGVWRLKHYVVMEEKIGRHIRIAERVYFLDGDRQNCSPENLELRPVKSKQAKTARQAMVKIAALERDLQELKLQVSDILSETIDRE